MGQSGGKTSLRTPAAKGYIKLSVEYIYPHPILILEVDAMSRNMSMREMSELDEVVRDLIREGEITPPIKKDGWGRERPMCKSCLITFGDGWGALKGFCSSCKHSQNVGCKCVLKCGGGK